MCYSFPPSFIFIKFEVLLACDAINSTTLFFLSFFLLFFPELWKYRKCTERARSRKEGLKRLRDGYGSGSWLPWPSILNRDIDTRDYNNKLERILAV